MNIGIKYQISLKWSKFNANLILVLVGRDLGWIIDINISMNIGIKYQMSLVWPKSNTNFILILIGRDLK
jgi:hypothetical protein